MTRRELLKWSGLAGIGSTVLSAQATGGMEQDGGWHKFSGGPVLGGQYGTCFDICVLREGSQFNMWLSWRPKKSVALTHSKDGIHWSAPEVVLGPCETGWEDDINRPVVVHRSDGFHMWYTGQARGKSAIGYAKSKNGRDWIRQSATPVLVADLPWEDVAVMCPHVMWDSQKRLWRMWYSGGQQYEPNAIGYATSRDGLHWEKFASNPVMTPDPKSDWEKERVTAAQIIKWKGWHYSFYIGFRDIDHAQIGLARSKDGVTNWVRHANNPIIRPTPDGWDADACYKPYAVNFNGQWMLWYNGRHSSLEQIGLALHAGDNLGFVAG